MNRNDNGSIKIAILVREETALICTGKGCLKSFFARTESFSVYGRCEVELIGFFHSGGDLEHKLARMKKAGVQVIHVSTCMRAKHPGYASLIQRLCKDFDVIGYTHGAADGKTKKTVSCTEKYLDKLINQSA